MKNLTMITIGIMVPTLIVSAFSMNVEFPLRNHPYAFYMIMGLAVSSVAVLFTVFWKYRR